MRARNVALVAVFTAAVVGSDFVLSGPEFSNIKLLDTLVFVSAYVFGFRIGAMVGILSETIWSFASPVGIAGAIAPFLVLGEVVFALAGWAASRAWGHQDGVPFPYPLFMGALLALSAFAWDFETNAATALLANWPGLTLPMVFAYAFNPYTLLFVIAHEGSDFVFGTLLAPLFILMIPRAMRLRA